MNEDDYQYFYCWYLPKQREDLNNGLTDKLFEQVVSAENERENDDFQYKDKYTTIVLGALLMRAGAKIKPEYIQHLKQLVPQIPCGYGAAMPFADPGFRKPGRAQFLAALDHHVDGVPRNFEIPRYMIRFVLAPILTSIVASDVGRLRLI
jgi:hypothetical protein